MPVCSMPTPSIRVLNLKPTMLDFNNIVPKYNLDPTLKSVVIYFAKVWNIIQIIYGALRLVFFQRKLLVISSQTGNYSPCMTPLKSIVLASNSINRRGINSRNFDPNQQGTAQHTRHRQGFFLWCDPMGSNTIFVETMSNCISSTYLTFRNTESNIHNWYNIANLQFKMGDGKKFQKYVLIYYD